MIKSLISKPLKLSAPFLLSSLFFGNQAYAEALIDIFNQAKANAPDYQVKQLAMDVLKTQSKKTQAEYFPTIDFDASYSHTWQKVKRSETGVFPVEETDYPTTNLALTLKQKVYDGNLIDRIKKSDQELKQSQVQLSAAEQELMYQVVENYFSILAAQDQLTLSQAEAKAIQSEHELTYAKYQKGLVNLLQWQEIQSRYAEAKAAISEAKLGLHTAKFRLKQLTGTEHSNLDPLIDNFKDLALTLVKDENWLAIANQNNLNIQAQRFAIAAANQEISAQKKGYYPKVDLILSANRDDAQGSLYGGGNKIDNYQAKLALNLPIWHGGITDSAINEAKKQKTIQQQVLKKIESEVETEVETSVYSIQAALIKIEAMQQSTKAYELALGAKRSGFKSGLFTSVDVLDAESKLYFAKKQLSASLYQLLLSYIKLKQVTGLLNQDEFAVIQTWLKQNH